MGAGPDDHGLDGGASGGTRGVDEAQRRSRSDEKDSNRIWQATDVLFEMLRKLRVESNSRVRLHGLRSKAHLNGTFAIVLGVDDTGTSFMVQLEDGKGDPFKVKPDRVEAAPKMMSEIDRRAAELVSQGTFQGTTLLKEGDIVELHSLKDERFNGTRATVLSCGTMGKVAQTFDFEQNRLSVRIVERDGRVSERKIKAANLRFVKMGENTLRSLVMDRSMQASTLIPSFGKTPLTPDALEEFRARVIDGDPVLSDRPVTPADLAAFTDLEARVEKYSDRKAALDYSNHICTLEAVKRGIQAFSRTLLYGTPDPQQQVDIAKAEISKIEHRLLTASALDDTPENFEKSASVPANLHLGQRLPNKSEATMDQRCYSCDSYNASLRCAKCKVKNITLLLRIYIFG